MTSRTFKVTEFWYRTKKCTVKMHLSFIFIFEVRIQYCGFFCMP